MSNLETETKEENDIIDILSSDESDDSEEEYIPTKHDKFEQYYLEREMRRAIREAKTMDEMLYDLGLDLPPEELN